MVEKFPGFEKCMAMMRRRNAAIQEDGYHWLLPRSREFVPELVREYSAEQDQGLRCWLLELLAEARAPELLDLFRGALHDGHEGVQDRGVMGRRKLDTAEARSVLWDERELVAAIEKQGK